MDNNQKFSADHIVEHLLAIGVDGETMEYIIDGTHMREQMLKQLAMKASDQDLNTIMSERDAIHDRGRNSHLVVERLDPNTDTVLSSDYIVRRNCESSRTEEIPLEQRYLIKRALDFYIKTSKAMVRNPSDDDRDLWFDMHALSEMMEYPIHIEISEKEIEEFCSVYNVEFPKWD